MRRRGAPNTGGVKNPHSLVPPPKADTGLLAIKEVAGRGYGAFAKGAIPEDHGQLAAYTGERLTKEEADGYVGDETYLMTHGQGHVLNALDPAITARFRPGGRRFLKSVRDTAGKWKLGSCGGVTSERHCGTGAGQVRDIFLFACRRGRFSVEFLRIQTI